MINIAKRFASFNSTNQISEKSLSIFVDIMKNTAIDRYKYYGDPEFTKIPSGLLSDEYAKKNSKSNKNYKTSK